jgi:hypothetical protein
MNRNRVKLRVLLLIGVLILPFLGWWEGRIKTASASETSFILAIHDNLLSAKIETVSLTKVLERLAQLTLIESSLDGSIGNETVTVEFENLPLEEGIRRILQGKSYALTYSQTSFSRGDAALPKVVGIRVVPKGAGPNTAKRDADSVIVPQNRTEILGQPNPQQEQARESLAAADTKARLAALTALMEGAEEKKAEALQTIVAGLKDEDADVREAALDVLENGDGPVPLEPLSEVAMNDGRPQHRMAALMLLAERNGQAALGPLKQALKDPDPGVSEMAQTLLAGVSEDIH